MLYQLSYARKRGFLLHLGRACCDNLSVARRLSDPSARIITHGRARAKRGRQTAPLDRSGPGLLAVLRAAPALDRQPPPCPLRPPLDGYRAGTYRQRYAAWRGPLVVADFQDAGRLVPIEAARNGELPVGYVMSPPRLPVEQANRAIVLERSVPPGRRDVVLSDAPQLAQAVVQVIVVRKRLEGYWWVDDRDMDEAVAVAQVL